MAEIQKLNNPKISYFSKRTVIKYEDILQGAVLLRCFISDVRKENGQECERNPALI
jgi:hypothetical protein